jgi:hypothetical protein
MGRVADRVTLNRQDFLRKGAVVAAAGAAAGKSLGLLGKVTPAEATEMLYADSNYQDVRAYPLSDLQTALNSIVGGGTVFAPEGLITVNAPLDVPAGVGILGSSRSSLDNPTVPAQGTIIQAGATVNEIILLHAECFLQNLTVYDPAPTPKATVAGIFSQDGSGRLIDVAVIEQASVPAVLVQASTGTILGWHIEGGRYRGAGSLSSSEAIVLDNCTDNLIVGVRMLGLGSSFHAKHNCSGTQVIGCRIGGQAGYVNAIVQSNEVFFVGCEFDSAAAGNGTAGQDNVNVLLGRGFDASRVSFVGCLFRNFNVPDISYPAVLIDASTGSKADDVLFDGCRVAARSLNRYKSFVRIAGTGGTASRVRVVGLSGTDCQSLFSSTGSTPVWKAESCHVHDSGAGGTDHLSENSGQFTGTASGSGPYTMSWPHSLGLPTGVLPGSFQATPMNSAALGASITADNTQITATWTANPGTGNIQFAWSARYFA